MDTGTRDLPSATLEAEIKCGLSDAWQAIMGEVAGAAPVK